MADITNVDRLLTLAAARAAGFSYDADGKLSCTLDQLVEYTTQLTMEYAQTLMDRLDEIKGR